ncbi:MAG TPA: hypothetical protein VM755_18700 [Stellaceae bacterium]|nr:hypothetical protein [Stellaceae bacterium]
MLDTAAGSRIEKAIQKALAGDAIALRFCLARILAPRRHSSVELDLPPLDSAKDIAAGTAAIAKAAADGVIAPAEALELSRVVDTAIRALAVREEERREWARRQPLKEGKLPLF